MNKIEGNIYTESCINIDTNKAHNLLIYEYSINNNKKQKMFVGEIVDDNVDTKELLFCLNKVVNCNVNDSLPIFACSWIKYGINKNLFLSVNFSKKGYNFIFNKDLNILNCEFKRDIYYSSIDFNNNLNEQVIIDYTSKRFCSIGDNLNSYPLDYYVDSKEHTEISGQKCLTYQN